MTTLQIIFVVGLLLTVVAAIWIRSINKQFAEYSSYVPDADQADEGQK